MKILAHSKDPRSNELITYQGEIPTYLLPKILKFKKLEVTWNKIAYNDWVLPKVGRKSATAPPKHKCLIVVLMLNLGWSAPLLAIPC